MSRAPASNQGTVRLVYGVGALATCAAAVAALFTENDLETTLLMASAVIAGLLCFDVSMERRLQSRVPWLAVSLAPLAKTAPLVWFDLQSNDGMLIERYDHAGSLLLGLLFLIAVVSLSRPARELGFDVGVFDLVVVIGAGCTAAAAGASVAFLFDRNFGTVTMGRLLETPTWFVVGAALAAVVLAAAHAHALSWPLAGLLLVTSAAAALLAFTAAGGRIDRGWWAMVFAGLAVSAGLLGPARLGMRDGRTRPSIAGVVVAVVVGLLAAATAIMARSEPVWGPGWMVLGVLALAMFGLAMASKPVDRQGRVDHEDQMRRDIAAFEPDALAREQALETFRSAAPADLTTADISPVQPEVSVPVADVSPTYPPQPQPQPQPQWQVQPEVSVPVADVSPTYPPDSQSQSQSQWQVQPQPPVPAPVADLPVADAPIPDFDRELRATQNEPADVSPPLSDTALVPSARAAAAVRETPGPERHDTAPLAQAHYFDPSTGLLSAAGLQRALASAFSTPRHAGHVTMMMFTIRDLGQIETDYGRLASAAVTREIAERVRQLMPAGTPARFARAAYAVIFVGDLGESTETAQSLARTLLQLRAPLSDGVVGARIDVVAGMAQCYDNEDVASFVQRANQGLARAVQTEEATFVSMP